MRTSTASRTRATLLGRLRACPTDQAAWSEFVAVYGPKIHDWCRGWNLQEADACDVTQDVLMKLAKLMNSFDYDPSRSFRAWLKTVTHHAWRDFVDSRKAQNMGVGGSHNLAVLQTVGAGEDLERRLEDEFDYELLEEARRCVQRRVASQTWEAFRLMTESSLSAREIAARVGMQVAMVYVAKSKVQRMLTEEIANLESEST